MHPNPAFRSDPKERHIAFARDRAFGTLAVNADAGPLLSHIPFLLSDNAQSADLHLVRSNPIARLGSVPAVIAVMGPDSYISPDWYGVPDQVPTWNYVAVHLRGQLVPLPHDTMRDMLDRQSASYEGRLLPKAPWSADKMTPEVLERMIQMISPFRFHIEKIEGTWKFGQNKPDDVRLAAAEHVSHDGFGSETRMLAEMMRDE